MRKTCVMMLVSLLVIPLLGVATSEVKAASAVDPYVGIWLNQINDGSWAQLQIQEIENGSLLIHFWGWGGAAPAYLNDAGQHLFTVESSPFTIVWSSYTVEVLTPFAVRTMTFSLEGSILYLHTLTHFIDNSGRADYTQDSQFIRVLDDSSLSIQDLQGQIQAMNSTIQNLTQQITSLNSQSNDLSLLRNIVYILIAVSVALAATLVYLIRRKPNAHK